MLSGRKAFEGTDRRAMASSGSPALDRLVGGCVAKEPAARIQRIQKVMLELKLLAVSASRSAAQAVPRRDPAAELQQMEDRLRAELRQIEERITARLEAALGRIQQLEQAEPVAVPDTAPLESAMEGIRHQVSELHQMVGQDFLNFEKVLQSQATAIDSARTAIAQTDDLVERVVEALESLQATVLENSEDRALSMN